MEYGSNVNFIKSVTKMTPLHWAAYNDDKDTVRLLIENGADIGFFNA